MHDDAGGELLARWSRSRVPVVIFFRGETDSRVVTKDGPPRVQRIEEGDSQTEALPEGPCQKSVDCKDTEVAMNPHFIFHGRKVCFWDPDARCACAKQLGVDDKAFCERGHY